MKTSINEFYIIGIAIRTTNQDGQGAKDIPMLWEKFIAENITAQIPGKLCNDIYCVYTEYEGDYTQPYTTVIGYRVESLESVPGGLTGVTIPGGSYRIFTAEGKLSDGIVINAWNTIWNTPVNRSYTADFEVYSSDNRNPDNTEVNIYIGVK